MYGLQTQSMLHSQWHNSDTEPRKGFILSWMAADVPCGFTEGRLAGLRSMFPKLRAIFYILHTQSLSGFCIAVFYAF